MLHTVGTHILVPVAHTHRETPYSYLLRYLWPLIDQVRSVSILQALQACAPARSEYTVLGEVTAIFYPCYLISYFSKALNHIGRLFPTANTK